MTRPQQPDSTTNVDSNVDNDSVSLSGRRDLNPRPPEPHFGAGVPDVRHDAGLSSESAEVHPTAPPAESGSAEAQRGQQRGQAPDDEALDDDGLTRAQRTLLDGAVDAAWLRRPHPLAVKADTPCPRCGCPWLRPGLDFSDTDVDEIPIVDLCARCKCRRGLPAEGNQT